MSQIIKNARVQYIQLGHKVTSLYDNKTLDFWCHGPQNMVLGLTLVVVKRINNKDDTRTCFIKYLTTLVKYKTNPN